MMVWDKFFVIWKDIKWKSCENIFPNTYSCLSPERLGKVWQRKRRKQLMREGREGRQEGKKGGGREERTNSGASYSWHYYLLLWSFLWRFLDYLCTYSYALERPIFCLLFFSFSRYLWILVFENFCCWRRKSVLLLLYVYSSLAMHYLCTADRLYHRNLADFPVRKRPGNPFICLDCFLKSLVYI